MKLLNLIKRILGHAEYTEAIADKYGNTNIPGGYAGGSLAAQNILLISNTELPSEVVKSVIAKEEAYYSVVTLDEQMTDKVITNAGRDLIGPFTHVINVFFDKEERPLLNGNKYNEKDSVYQLYQWQQVEVDYLVKLNQYATICTIFIGESSIEGNVKKHNVEMCIRGLAEVLSNHGMICNGIIANKDIDFKDLLTTSVFLSSRYGQIMTGEVLKLN